LATAYASGRPLSSGKCSTAIRWSSRSRRRRRRVLRQVDPRPRQASRVTPSPASSQRRNPSARRAVEGSPASMVIAAASAEPPASSFSMLGSLQRARGAGASASGSMWALPAGSVLWNSGRFDRLGNCAAARENGQTQPLTPGPNCSGKNSARRLPRGCGRPERAKEFHRPGIGRVASPPLPISRLCARSPVAVIGR
jgi:hypothetical protein